MQSQQINLTDMDENSSIERTMLTTPLSPTNNKGVEPNSTPVFSPEEMILLETITMWQELQEC